MFKRKLRFFLHRWHRRLGLSAVLVIIMVSITGVMLNHTGDLSLAKQYPQSSLWLWPYPDNANMGFQFGQTVIYDTAQAVYLNDQLLASCPPPLLNAVNLENQLWILCQGQLLYLKNLQLIESIDTQLLTTSNAQNINGLAQLNGQVILQTANQWCTLDTLSLMLGEPSPAPTSLSIPHILDAKYQINHSISWQKVILDLHSGRFFGDFGVYVVDLAAFILLLLSLSGFWIWYSRR